MSASLTPEPLTPPDCDLRDFGFMPLDVRRLLTSETWIEAADDPKLGHALICLWCESWHQIPAGSLPDNDRVLARFAMCDREDWARIRERALEDWVRCSDGRLYHPVVAEKARDAWLEKVAYRERKEEFSNRQRARANIRWGRTEGAEEDAGRYATALPRHESGNACGNAAKMPMKGTGTGTGTKENKKEDTALRTDRRPASRSGESYAFESGVIRLNAGDLARWRAAYPALSLEAELLSLSEWAGRPETRSKWFNAVQGALTKRQRDHGLSVERVKAEGAARAHGPPARQPSAYVP
jgi:hypothetical protein